MSEVRSIRYLVWIPILLVVTTAALAVALTESVSEVFVRLVVGVLGVIGCGEVVLYSAGYTSKLDHLIPLRLRLRTPGLRKILIGLLAFVVGMSIYNMLLYLTPNIDRVVAAAISALTTYFVTRGLSRAISSSPLTLIIVTVVAVIALVELSSDDDYAYVENLLKLFEEVIRHAL